MRGSSATVWNRNTIGVENLSSAVYITGSRTFHPSISLWTHYKLADVPQAAEPQVGNVHLDLVPVLVGGVDVRDAGSADEGNALVTWAFGHKQHGGLLGSDGTSPI